MGDGGFLSKKRELAIAKFLDAEVDCNKLFGEKKLFGLIRIGNYMERNDRKIFQFGVAILDDKILSKNATPERIAAIEKALTMLENHDVSGFIDYIAGVFSGIIDIPYTTSEKQLFLGVFMLFSGMINRTIEAIEKAIAEAEKEEQ
jgi:hypothetical protein